VLKKVREGIYPNQADFAKRIGHTQSYISKVETGRKKMDMAELIEYCNALGMSVTLYAAEVEYGLYHKKPKEERLNQYNRDFIKKVLAVFQSFYLT
jgi:transcriptional regulator with XRE-family HTH domain